MIDHLLIAADQATLITTIGAHNPDGRGPLWNPGGPNGLGGSTPPGWRSDIAFPVTISDTSKMQQVGTKTVTTLNLDGTTTTTQVPILAPTPLTDYHVWVALPAKDPTLAALPNCALAADRDAANAGNPNFILQTGFTQAQMDVYVVSPVMAGSKYPFGSV